MYFIKTKTHVFIRVWSYKERSETDPIGFYQMADTRLDMNVLALKIDRECEGNEP